MSLFFLTKEREGKSVFSFLFQFQPHPWSFVSSFALRFPPFCLSRGLFFLSSADVSAYIAERRRINSQVLSDTIARITASCVSFSAAREGERSAPLRGDLRIAKGDGRRGWRRLRLFCAQVSQFNDHPLESSQ